MDFNAGDLISFILVIFSIIIAIVPLIETPNEDHISAQLGAISTLINKPSLAEQILSYNILHNFNRIEQIEKSHSTNPKLAEENLAMSIAHYNSDQSNHKSSSYPNQYFRNLNVSNLVGGVGSSILSKEIWFTKREFDMENFNYGLTKWKEDAICNKPQCSYWELRNVSNSIEELSQNGFLDNFYNNAQKVQSLSKPLDAFISDLNNFIIISLIIGPIVFFAGIRLYVNYEQNVKVK